MTRSASIFGSPKKPLDRGRGVAGGDFAVHGAHDLVQDLRTRFAFLDARWALRLVRAYGTDAFEMLGEAATLDDLGQPFGATLTEREVEWLMDNEYARHAADIVWRRSKLGLRMSEDEMRTLDAWMAARASALKTAAAE